MLGDHYEFPGAIKGELLDKYLAKGWYRTGCIIFTTHYLKPYNTDERYRVYWLRYLTEQLTLDKKAKQIIANNRNFTIAVKPLEITKELYRLHKKYVQSLKFESCNDLNDLLTDSGNIFFDSYVIEIRDGARLIGAGIFDLGHQAIAGIINIYDPEYRKYSLGKLLMMMKYKVCLENGIPLYYPGYYMPDHPLFDYKLFLDKAATEIYVPETETWEPFNTFISNYKATRLVTGKE
ncbi:MAG: arginine-tRNA-protein transferase [Chitinophagia bacterium]|nr:arginine-tRNA-protein transferase [Chitinophagia bacterium]